jgi:hypothetical protein
MARGPLAGASGPGKFSKRTDLPSAYYGEGQETAMLSTAAPKATTRGIADNVGGRPANPITQLYAPTERPSEPITTGIDMGDGAGSEALMMQKTSVKTSDTLAPLLPFDTTGEIGILYQDALSRGD